VGSRKTCQKRLVGVTRSGVVVEASKWVRWCQNQGAYIFPWDKPGGSPPTGQAARALEGVIDVREVRTRTGEHDRHDTPSPIAPTSTDERDCMKAKRIIGALPVDDFGSASGSDPGSCRRGSNRPR
jgi:hypothetical protein